MATPAAPAPAVPALVSANTSRYITHVVIIVQENRSFDNLFEGYPGAETSTFGYTHTGSKVALQPITFDGSDMYHDWSNAITNWDNGKMDAFDKGTLVSGAPAGTYPYAYVRHDLVAPYWAMARQYVLTDHLFPTIFGPSFTSHLSLIASTTHLSPTQAEVDGPNAQPWGCDAPASTTTYLLTQSRQPSNTGPFPCFTQFRTLADTLDAAHVSWKFYTPGGFGGKMWTPFASIARVHNGLDWTRNVVTPQTTVLSDAADGKLASVSWVVPDLLDSDHAGSNSDKGPSWVATVVNAIGKSRYWNSTAIVVTWDEWGGWYDNVPPPQKDFAGLAIRVPGLVISPYAKRAYVSHTQYEFGSIVKLVEQAFGLPPLGPESAGYTDTRANSLLDVFNFTQKPRVFRPFEVPYKPAYFVTRPASKQPPDDD
jgi:phospholipase C